MSWVIFVESVSSTLQGWDYPDRSACNFILRMTVSPMAIALENDNGVHKDLHSWLFITQSLCFFFTKM